MDEEPRHDGGDEKTSGNGENDEAVVSEQLGGKSWQREADQSIDAQKGVTDDQVGGVEGCQEVEGGAVDN